MVLHLKGSKMASLKRLALVAITASLVLTLLVIESVNHTGSIL